MTAWDGSLSTAGMDQISGRPMLSKATPRAARAAALHAAGAGYAVRRQRGETGEPDERAGRGHLQGPESEPLAVETGLDHLDQRVAGGAVEPGREGPQGLGGGGQVGG